MKLRNKKTGGIGELIQYADFAYDKKGEFYIKINGDYEEYYNSFQQMLDAGWEVYRQPTKPLIKDEKIRKAVRAWAEAIDENDNLIVSYSMKYHYCCIYADNRGSTALIVFNKKLEIEEGSYTITELCGEEDNA